MPLINKNNIDNIIKSGTFIIFGYGADFYSMITNLEAKYGCRYIMLDGGLTYIVDGKYFDKISKILTCDQTIVWESQYSIIDVFNIFFINRFYSIDDIDNDGGFKRIKIQLNK